jgi:signal transduction histidine kinase
MEEGLKEAQEQIFRTSKMASLGQLSAGAAHEINNPLAGIVGFAEATLLDLKNQKIAPDKIARALKIILKNAERCRVIIGNLLNFARTKELQKQGSDINSLLNGALSLVEYKTTAQSIKVVKRYEKNLRKVNIDLDQMTQVFINVISNAQNAMPDGGKLLVRTWSENDFVGIEFKDTGTGIEKGNLSKVFEPFFTTRRTGQGVGLGLSISYGIMKGHEGSIEAKSDGKDKGTSFIIKIPEKGEINGHE